MCLRFLLEGCEENRELVRGLEGRVGRGAGAGSVLGNRNGREESELVRLREEVKEQQKEVKRKEKEGELEGEGKEDENGEQVLPEKARISF